MRAHIRTPGRAGDGKDGRVDDRRGGRRVGWQSACPAGRQAVPPGRRASVRAPVSPYIPQPVFTHCAGPMCGWGAARGSPCAPHPGCLRHPARSPRGARRRCAGVSGCPPPRRPRDCQAPPRRGRGVLGVTPRGGARSRSPRGRPAARRCARRTRSGRNRSRRARCRGSSRRVGHPPAPGRPHTQGPDRRRPCG